MERDEDRESWHVRNIAESEASRARNPLGVTAIRITANLWADYVSLTGEGTPAEVCATYNNGLGDVYPYVWIPRGEVIRDWNK